MSLEKITTTKPFLMGIARRINEIIDALKPLQNITSNDKTVTVTVASNNIDLSASPDGGDPDPPGPTPDGAVYSVTLTPAGVLPTQFEISSAIANFYSSDLMEYPVFGDTVLLFVSGVLKLSAKCLDATGSTSFWFPTVSVNPGSGAQAFRFLITQHGLY